MIGVGRYTPERPGNVCLGRPSLIPASAVLEQLSDSSTTEKPSPNRYIRILGKEWDHD